MAIFDEILRRRVPHILGSYLIAASSLILFVDWIVNRYTFPGHYTTFSLLGVIGIIPSVLILAYFHGAPGKDKWQRLDKICIPLNIIAVLILYYGGEKIGLFSNNEVNYIVKKKYTLLIGNIFSDADHKKIISKNIISENYETLEKLETVNSFESIEYELLDNYYDEMVTTLISSLSYVDDFNINTIHELKEDYLKTNKLFPEYRINAYDMFIYEKFDSNWEGSAQELLYKNNFDLGLFPVLYKLKEPIDGSTHILITGLLFEKSENEENTDYFISWRDELVNLNNLFNKISNHFNELVEEEFYWGKNDIEIVDINNEDIVLQLNNIKIPIKSNMILHVERNNELNALDTNYIHQIDELIEDYTEILRTLSKLNNNIFVYTETDFIEEYDDIKNETHPLVEYKNWGIAMRKDTSLANIDLSIDYAIPLKVKIVNVYDSTATAKILEGSKELITLLKVGDKIVLKW